MRKILEDAKAIIAELIGIIGGFWWGNATKWDFEPLILLIASSIGLLSSLSLLLLKKDNKASVTATNNIADKNTLSKENKTEIGSGVSTKVVNNDIEVVTPRVESKSEIVRQKYSKETPRTIKDKINASPLYQKDEIAKHYLGLLVKWELDLFIIHKRKSPQIEVVMSFGGRLFPDIVFDINTDAYSVFKTAEKGKKFLVIGKIIDCKENVIKLNIIDIEEI